MHNRAKLKLGLLSASMFTAAATLAAAPAFAQDLAAESMDEGDAIIVTATRRSTTVMETPINISVLGGDDLEANRIDDVRDIAAFTPGVTIADTGGASAGRIILRGLQAADTSSNGANFDSAMGIYLGEVPLYYDFKTLDLERIETLLGPQGTLYGLGTLAGAIRFIPNRPDADGFEAELHGRGYAKAESEDLGYQFDGMVNIPIVPGKVAFRSATGYYFDPGFIDYTLLVQEPGISLPQPAGSGPITDEFYDANLRRENDLNFEKTFTTRNQLLLQPVDNLQIYLTYAYQRTRTDGTQANSDFVLGTGQYENASRYVEPRERSAHLYALEVNANVGEIFDVVATGAYTEVTTDQIGDVTDLLLDLDYGYENYPGFSGFSTLAAKREQANVELRFVSTHGGPLSWVLGTFYNENKLQQDNNEILPNHPGNDPIFNPEFIEYVAYTSSRVNEQAVFGEATFEVIPQWQVTGGLRYYDYTSKIAGAQSLPFLGQPVSPYDLDAAGGVGGEDGLVWKFNSSFEITPDLLLYGTYSKGYRLGGPNTAAPCPEGTPLDPSEYDGPQLVCALPSEIQFGPDTTKNIEVGLRAQLFDNRLNLNVNVFQVDWEGLQVASATLYGITGITVNAGAARSRGIEASFQLMPVDALTIQGSYSYLNAELTENVDDIIAVNDPPGVYPTAPVRLDALAGDRLPGSADHSGSLGVNYTLPLGEAELVASWIAAYKGSIVTRLGWDRAFGDELPGYLLNGASLSYNTDTYSISLFADNIFNEYAVSAVQNDRSRVGLNNGVRLRYLENAVINPRTVGIEARMNF